MRKGLLRLSLLGLVLASACADDPNSQPDANTAIGGDGSRIHRTDSGRLTAPSVAQTSDVVKSYLQPFVSDAVDQMKLLSQSAPVNGITHVRYEQVVGGLRVYGAYVRVAITEKGELVQVIENLAPAVGLPRAASIKHKDALGIAMKELGYDFATPAQTSGSGNKLGFAKGTEFYREPTVEKVAYYDGNALKQGYLVETWSQRGNQLDHTLIGSNGSIVSHELRTQNDSYNVYVEDPGKNSQTIVNGPGGWLGAGAQTTQDISGPNAHAYLDATNDGQPDGGGTAVTSGNFTTAANLGVSPATEGNRNVAVQNLFYLNNVLHDTLNAHGFTVAEGNFEGNDPVNAEAQDGGGVDNANFSTPPDGQAPRMQMYLWTGSAPTHYVNGSIGAYQSSFGPAFVSPTSGSTQVMDPADGCTAANASLAGKIAIVNRGTCNFTDKVLNAQNAGATAVIIVNNSPASAFAPGGTSRRVKIPSAMVAQADGPAIGGSATITKNLVPALQIDGDLDSDIVNHEYGHGLTWRMVGSMSGAVSGAIGEGASDVVAFLINGDDRIGEYAYSDALGIRRLPYSDYGPSTLSYKNVDGGEVHNDGEIYAAAIWGVLEQYQANGLTATDLLHDFVQGLSFTNAGPNYEDMRSGLLQAVSADRACYVWRGFAKVGIGVGSALSGRKRLTITESYAVPPGC